MLLLQAKNIKKEYGTRTILDFEELSIYTGDRIGVVGANGAGKTTLLEVLMGKLLPDSGWVDSKYSTAYLPQFAETEDTLSGGENRKKQIAEHLVGTGHIVFADEPTANLDTKGVHWVEEQLKRADAMVLISHDRALLDRLCTHIVEIKNGKLLAYPGNYSQYLAAKALEKDQLLLRNRKRKNEEKSLKDAVQKKERQVARNRQSHKKNMLKNSSEAQLMKMGVARLEAAIQREGKVLKQRLERVEEQEFVEKNYRLLLDFSLTDPPGNPYVITGTDFSYSYGQKEIFANATFRIGRGERVAITGANGTGKTTLLRQIYEGHPAIFKVPQLKLGYLRQDFSQLDESKSVLENAMETSVQTESTTRNLLAGLLFFGEAVFKKAAVLSGGEKIKLSLAKLLLSENNGLLLDEPTNFLDIPSLEALEQTLQDYPGTLLFVSHDERFRERVATRTLAVQGKDLVDPTLAIKKPVNADEILLDIRRTQLIEAIGVTQGDAKKILEAEYQTLLNQIKLLKNSELNKTKLLKNSEVS